MTEKTTPAEDSPVPEEPPVDDEDAEVEGHLYGEYYKPQAEGRFGRSAAGKHPDASPPRKAGRLPKRNRGGSVG